MSRTIRERMNVRDNEVFTPIDLINAKTISSVINTFFGTNALSQFMDQTNPSGRDDAQASYVGTRPWWTFSRACGISRCATCTIPTTDVFVLLRPLRVLTSVLFRRFAFMPKSMTSDLSRLLTVRLKTERWISLTNGIEYMTAEVEEGHIIAQGNAPLNDDGTFVNSRVKARQNADFPVVSPEEVSLMDVSPTQIASIAASLIPFLEHDDANRALMGSNMMRQAVPLLRTEAPIVGTGLEGQLIRDSRTQITAEGAGVVEFVDATTIRIRYDRTEDEEFVSFESAVKEYRIPKFRKTNQSTTVDLRPICRKGDRVVTGQILTEGYSTENGELALGRNLKVAFMPWKGYNYEDAIVLNERVVREDILTSVHVDEYSLEVRETKRGMEELTSDIPNVSEDATKDLDERGIIRVGAHVRARRYHDW